MFEPLPIPPFYKITFPSISAFLSIIFSLYPYFFLIRNHYEISNFLIFSFIINIFITGIFFKFFFWSGNLFLENQKNTVIGLLGAIFGAGLQIFGFQLIRDSDNDNQHIILITMVSYGHDDPKLRFFLDFPNFAITSSYQWINFSYQNHVFIQFSLQGMQKFYTFFVFCTFHHSTDNQHPGGKKFGKVFSKRHSEIAFLQIVRYLFQIPGFYAFHFIKKSLITFCLSVLSVIILSDYYAPITEDSVSYNGNNMKIRGFGDK